MWPWEHVLLAYIVYSVYRRARSYPPPSNSAMIALVFGSLFPDVIDKPLAWGYGVFDSGYAIAHSVLFAVPTCAFLLLLSRRFGYREAAVGFSVGYLLHLVGDVIPISLRTGGLYVSHLFWPVIRHEEAVEHASFRDGFLHHLLPHIGELLSLDLSLALLLQLGVVGTGMILWFIDGRPGLRYAVAVIPGR